MNKYIENLIKKNFWLKLFSLIFAVIIWAYVVGGTKQDAVYTAGLTVEHLPKGYAVSNNLPKKIHLKLRGSRIALMKINKKIFFKINGYSLLAKKNTIILNGSYLELPGGIKIIGISPRIIPVIISRIITRYVKVLPVTAGRLPKGYRLKYISVFPQYVSVSGPKDIVGHLSVITTMDINLNNIAQNKLLTVSLRKPTKLVKILYNKKVNINITVAKLKDSRR
ncbi:MAG: CdaR family protein [bacterium]